MFVPRTWIVLLVLLVLAAAALANARASDGAAPESRHIVLPGETLWGIAAANYGGDPRAAVWKIERRNGLAGAELAPGTVLYLPR